MKTIISHTPVRRRLERGHFSAGENPFIIEKLERRLLWSVAAATEAVIATLDPVVVSIDMPSDSVDSSCSTDVVVDDNTTDSSTTDDSTSGDTEGADVSTDDTSTDTTDQTATDNVAVEDSSVAVPNIYYFGGINETAIMVEKTGVEVAVDPTASSTDTATTDVAAVDDTNMTTDVPPVDVSTDPITDAGVPVDTTIDPTTTVDTTDSGSVDGGTVNVDPPFINYFGGINESGGILTTTDTTTITDTTTPTDVTDTVDTTVDPVVDPTIPDPVAGGVTDTTDGNTDGTTPVIETLGGGVTLDNPDVIFYNMMPGRGVDAAGGIQPNFRDLAGGIKTTGSTVATTTSSNAPGGSAGFVAFVKPIEPKVLSTDSISNSVFATDDVLKLKSTKDILA